MTERTAVGKFWLWFRFPLLTFAGCCGVACVVGLCQLCTSLFREGHWILASLAVAVSVSLAFGTVIYSAHRSDNPSQYY
jgi:hypothetical protein